MGHKHERNSQNQPLIGTETFRPYRMYIIHNANKLIAMFLDNSIRRRGLIKYEDFDNQIFITLLPIWLLGQRSGSIHCLSKKRECQKLRPPGRPPPDSSFLIRTGMVTVSSIWGGLFYLTLSDISGIS